MAKLRISPEQEAARALDQGLPRSGLSRHAQPAYDRLSRERAATERVISERRKMASLSAQSSICSDCGAELPHDARFCASCGTPANVGTQGTDCTQCGSELTSQAIQQSFS